MKRYNRGNSLAFALLFTMAAQILLVQAASAVTFQTLTQYQVRYYKFTAYIFPITPAAINPDSCSLAGGGGYRTLYTRSENAMELLNAAAINDKPIVIALEGCAESGKPIVVSVSVNSG